MLTWVALFLAGLCAAGPRAFVDVKRAGPDEGVDAKPQLRAGARPAELLQQDLIRIKILDQDQDQHDRLLTKSRHTAKFARRDVLGHNLVDFVTRSYYRGSLRQENGGFFFACHAKMTTSCPTSTKEYSSESVTEGKLENLDGVIPIVDSSSYPCYNFGMKPVPSSHSRFLAPIFPTGSSWPQLARGKIKVGLNKAQVYVVSLAAAKKRRESFARQWATLDLDLPARWVEAVDGYSPLGKTRFQREVLEKNKEDVATGVGVRGVAGCWETHAGLLSAHTSGDMMVFEDDAVFDLNFTALFQEFVKSVPRDWDQLHFGGDDFWDPPLAELPGKWIRTRGSSRTWGYVVRESAVSRLRHSNDVTMDLRAVDAFYGGLAYACSSEHRQNTYTPSRPLVFSAGGVSMTAQQVNYLLQAEDNPIENEDPRVHNFTWYPVTCCLYGDHPNLAWSRWCCAHGGNDTASDPTRKDYCKQLQSRKGR